MAQNYRNVLLSMVHKIRHHLPSPWLFALILLGGLAVVAAVWLDRTYRWPSQSPLLANVIAGLLGLPASAVITFLVVDAILQAERKRRTRRATAWRLWHLQVRINNIVGLLHNMYVLKEDQIGYEIDTPRIHQALVRLQDRIAAIDVAAATELAQSFLEPSVSTRHVSMALHRLAEQLLTYAEDETQYMESAQWLQSLADAWSGAIEDPRRPGMLQAFIGNTATEQDWCLLYSEVSGTATMVNLLRIIGLPAPSRSDLGIA